MDHTGFKGKTVLIADDEEYVRHHLSRRLSSLDLTVLQARTGKDVLAQVSDKPDLIIMDLRMPVLDGLETFRRLKADEASRAIPVVLLSALSRDEGAASEIIDNADEYIMKPITFNRLLESIRRHLD